MDAKEKQKELYNGFLQISTPQKWGCDTKLPKSRRSPPMASTSKTGKSWTFEEACALGWDTNIWVNLAYWLGSFMLLTRLIHTWWNVMPSGLCIMDPARWFDDVLGGFSIYSKIGYVSGNPIFGGASFTGKCFLGGDFPCLLLKLH